MAGLAAAGHGDAARFGVLGPLQAVDAAGITWPVRAAKQRVILAALLLNVGATVSAASMSEALWDVSPPPSAPAAMRTYVMRLRRALGPLGSRVARQPPGWALTLNSADELDLTEVGQLQSAARVAGAAGDWIRVSALLASALSLWRGEPLIDVSSAVLTRRDADRLTELRLQLTMARIDADMHLGRHAELVPELRRLAAEHPLHEHIRVQLMVAYYRCGHQAAAFNAFQDAHRTLAEELGVEPGPELREVHRRILAADPDLSVLPAGTVHSPEPPSGREAVALTGPPSHADSRPVPVPLTVPHQVPAGTRHFAGRARELDALSALLHDAEGSAAVVICAVGGSAGVGKTALAVHWAHQVADRFPDGQLYADLGGWGPSADPVPPGDLITRFLAALGVSADQLPAGADARQDLYRSLLAGRRMLIVLDNARDAAHVRPLLPGGSSCVVLITSRSRLGSLIAAEAATPLSLQVLTEAEARELLVSRLGPQRVAVEPDAADELAELCGRLPLALAIAASRAALHPAIPLATLADGLRDASARLAVLDAGENFSVDAAFSSSYRNLPTPARDMFRLLGLHPGPDISAAAAASLTGTSPGQAGAMLRQLAEASLLTEHVPGRFRFHDLLRAYAAGRANAQEGLPSQRAAIHRALDHYLHSSHAASWSLRKCPATISLSSPRPGVVPESSGDFRQAITWFDAEQHVLAALVDHAASTGFDAHCWQLAVTFASFFDHQGSTGICLSMLQAALAAAQRLDDSHARTRVHCRIAGTFIQIGAYADAERHYQQALALSEQAGDRAGQEIAHFGLGLTADCQGRYRRALAHASRTLTLSPSGDDPGVRATALDNVGWYHARLGEYEHALDYCPQAINLHRELGGWYFEAQAWDSLGYAQSHLGQHTEAVSSYQQAVELFRQAGTHTAETLSLGNLGDAYEAASQPRLAVQARRQAQAILDELPPQTPGNQHQTPPHQPASA